MFKKRPKPIPVVHVDATTSAATASETKAATKIAAQIRGQKARAEVLSAVGTKAAEKVPTGKPWDGDLEAEIARQRWRRLRRAKVGRGDSATGFVNKALEALMPVVIRGAEAALIKYLGQDGGLPLGDAKDPVYRLRVRDRHSPDQPPKKVLRS